MKVQLVNFLEKEASLQVETLSWRNAPHVARYFQMQAIDMATHLNWLQKLKELPPTTVAFFIEVNQKSVGVTYFHSIDYETQSADWGIYLHDENTRGKGIGKEALRLSLAYAQTTLQLRRVYLEVLSENGVAKHLYEQVGFRLLEQEGSVLRYQKDL